MDATVPLRQHPITVVPWFYRDKCPAEALRPREETPGITGPKSSATTEANYSEFPEPARCPRRYTPLARRCIRPGPINAFAIALFDNILRIRDAAAFGKKSS